MFDNCASIQEDAIDEDWDLTILKERVKRYSMGSWTIRIWTEQDLPSEFELYKSIESGGQLMETAATRILSGWKANAVEIMGDYEGVVLYADWP